MSSSQKLTAQHLAKKAIVYLRQSSRTQVKDNLESHQLQYALADRASSLGFAHVEVIDRDLVIARLRGARLSHRFQSQAHATLDLLLPAPRAGLAERSDGIHRPNSKIAVALTCSAETSGGSIASATCACSISASPTFVARRRCFCSAADGASPINIPNHIELLSHPLQRADITQATRADNASGIQRDYWRRICWPKHDLP